MNLSYGDIISIDNDKWEFIGRKFEVLNVSRTKESTRVSMCIKDTFSENIFRIAVAENQIIKE